MHRIKASLLALAVACSACAADQRIPALQSEVVRLRADVAELKKWQKDLEQTVAAHHKPPTLNPLGVDATRFVKRLGYRRYQIKRSGLNAVLGKPQVLAQSARIVPSVSNGKPDGFRLYAIRPGSLYAVLGLKNGDVINRINGLSITTPDKALEVYTKIRNAKAITVSVKRGMKAIEFHYTVVD